MMVHELRHAPRGALLWLLIAACNVAVMVGGCGGSGPSGEGGSGGASGSGGAIVDAATGGSGGDARIDSEVVDADGGRCQIVVAQHPDEGALHLGQCTVAGCDCAPTTYLTNPPSSGNHYPIWADYKVYDKPVPWGYLVHDLEHGAVVISYRCPAAGCSVDLTAVRAFVDGLAPDNVCLSRKLITVVPDPDLDVAFAASAWTWTLRANCFDAAAFGDFVDQHYAHGLERICGGGVDLSAAGWCP